jgi:hypothetical protein
MMTLYLEAIIALQGMIPSTWFVVRPVLLLARAGTLLRASGAFSSKTFAAC